MYTTHRADKENYSPKLSYQESLLARSACLAAVQNVSPARCRIGGHGKYIGRIGVLAVALGIGLTAGHDPAPAQADSPDSTESSHDSSTNASQKKSPPSRKAAEASDQVTGPSTSGSARPGNAVAATTKLEVPSTSVFSRTGAEPDTYIPANSAANVSTSGVVAVSSAQITETNEMTTLPTVPPLAEPITNASPQPPAPSAQAPAAVKTPDTPTATATVDVVDRAVPRVTAPTRQGETTPDTKHAAIPQHHGSIASPANVAALTPMTTTNMSMARILPPATAAKVVTGVSSATMTFSASPTVASMRSAATALPTPSPAAMPSTGVTPIFRLVSRILSWAGVNPYATQSPVAPPTSPTLWALLGWARRQVQYTLFNRTPTIGFSPTSISETFGGVLLGNINARDADGDALTYTVIAGPTKGTVIVATDGSFIYTPTDAAAVYTVGLTDTFIVKVSDIRGNPFHLHGARTLFSLDAGASTTATIALTVKPVSTLATPDQLRLEQLAMQILNTAAVQQAKATIRDQWITQARQSFALIGGPDAKSMALLDQAVDEYAYALAQQVAMNDPTRPSVLAMLLPPHQWFDTEVAGGRFNPDNPDTIYRGIAVDSASSYVITGQFYGARPADINFGVYADISAAVPISNLSGNELVVNPDGSFTITVDSIPTAPGQTNHLQLTASAQQIFIRDTMSDLIAQTPPTLQVERLTGPETAPSRTLDEMSAQAAQLTVAASNSLHVLGTRLMTSNPVTGAVKAPNTLTPALQLPGTLLSQKQSAGYFNLADDQAMIITIEPGAARYFIVPVGNIWLTTDNYWDAQTSLNIDQANANPDGTYTLVLSPTDPRVANWIDTGGLHQGILPIRFQNIPPNATASPKVSFQTVSLDQLADNLPATTRYLTAEERADQLAARRAGYERRYAPLPAN